MSGSEIISGPFCQYRAAAMSAICQEFYPRSGRALSRLDAHRVPRL